MLIKIGTIRAWSLRKAIATVLSAVSSHGVPVPVSLSPCPCTRVPIQIKVVVDVVARNENTRDTKIQGYKKGQNCYRYMLRGTVSNSIPHTCCLLVGLRSRHLYGTRERQQKRPSQRWHMEGVLFEIGHLKSIVNVNEI